MSTINCEACSNLRENAPDFVANGVTDSICESLKNDTGLNPNAVSLHTDCEDLHDANDCLVGSLDSKIEAHEVCDWKTFMHKLVPNLYELIKAIICSICGLWEKVHKHDCQVNMLLNGATFSLNLDSSSANGYFVPGVGVDLATRAGEADPFTTGATIRYHGGAFGRCHGGIIMHATDWTGATIRDINGNLGKGNSVWASTDAVTVNGNELIYEIRIKKSAYDIAAIYGGIGHTTNGSYYTVTFHNFNAGSYAYGQHGACNEDGTPYAPGLSSGHLVPAGWIYVQMRAQYIGRIDGASTDAGSYNAPMAIFPMRMNTDDICD